MEGDTFVSFLVILLPSPNFVQFKYGHRSHYIYGSNPVNIETEGAIESVRFNGVSVLSGLNLEEM